ncbi:MAG: sulfatase [Candidatus Aegiribacteria sp.]|nr:sulfatase [Candidatus Aegiribacteria sp.]
MSRTSVFIFIPLLVIVLLISCGSNHQEHSVLLIILDAVRADHLSCYDYQRETTPVLDSLAEQGTIFTRCQAQSPWTLPSCASILTGLTTKSHGTTTSQRDTYRLDPTINTLTKILSEAGYMTAGIVNNPLLSQTLGFADYMDYYSFYPQGDGRSEETVNEAIEWLNTIATQPFFLMIHIMDPHAPHNPPEPYDTEYSQIGVSGGTVWFRDQDDRSIILNPEDRDHLVNMYDGEIRSVDVQLGRLFSEIREMGLSNELLIIVVADHGEEFLDHGTGGHGHTLYQELLHVPLIISGGNFASGVVVTEPVGQFDILPTVLDYLNLENPGSLDGISLLDEISDNRIIPSSGLRGLNLASVLCGFRKIIGDMDTYDYVMHDLINDPHELVPLTPDSDMFSDLEQYWSTPPLFNPPTANNAEEIDRTLRDLGYIN